jgi:nitrite reductase/ring-hydroxylating ferredoxin subunit
MLTREDNELMCRVGPGTPMGETLRQYWHPLLLSTELPTPDCPPIRARLLGEDLIAFRDSSGRVGIVATNCPHRGASLFFGRNEEDGLRCVYHGWKFDVTGRCIDMPSEPAESNFKDKVRLPAYKAEERGGVVWVYMGPRSEAPVIPDLPWFLVPEGHRFLTKRLQENNFVQAIEGGIDTTHASFLHMRLGNMPTREVHDAKTNRTWGGSDEATNLGISIAKRATSAYFELVDTDYGVMIASRRVASDTETYWRINQFLMPYYTMPPSHRVAERGGPKGGGGGGHAFVPMDDENTICWSFSMSPQRPYTAEEIERMHEYPNPGLHAGVPKGLLPATSAPMGAFRPIHNKTNDYGLDYELQKTVQFCGIPDRSTQDNAVQESMGVIIDRTKEHLGISDSGVIRMRRRLLDAARGMRDNGTTPPGVDSPAAYCVSGVGFILPTGEPWIDVAYDMCSLHPGVDIAGAPAAGRV